MKSKLHGVPQKPRKPYPKLVQNKTSLVVFLAADTREGMVVNLGNQLNLAHKLGEIYKFSEASLRGFDEEEYFQDYLGAITLEND